MIIVCLCMIFTLILLYLKEHTKLQQLQLDYHYINKRLDEILKQGDMNYILIPSDNAVVRETSVNINNLLEKYQKTQIHYHRAQKAQLQIFTNISHDLRTPITVLKGYIEMLYLQSLKEEMTFTTKNMIHKMHENAEEIVHSVNNFFNLAKLQSGDILLHIQRINLTQLCHETILEFYDLLEKEHVQVELHIQEQPIYADADSDAVQRILKNLIDNSMRYGSAGKYLGISLYEKQGEVCIDIEDHGSGIPESEQSLIFTRTYTMDKKKGSGLGLAISSQLAKAMGAVISVSSIPHVKTIFTLHLKC